MEKFLDGKKTYIGAGVTVLTMLLSIVTKIDLDQDLQAEITKLVTEILGLIGSGLAIYGRIVAKPKK